MTWDSYLAKKQFTLKCRELDLEKLLKSESTDQSKLEKAAELVIKAQLRILQGRFEQVELSSQKYRLIARNDKKTVRERTRVQEEMEKLKAKIDHWKSVSFDTVINKYR